MVVVDSSPTTKKKQSKPAGGLASKLFNKFDSDRKYDPFMAADLVIQDSKKGMENLLLMCNTVEINSLHSALGFSVPCPRKAKEQEVMGFIREGGRQVEKRFADVLKLFWEGLLFEYLRTVGCSLRNAEHDPRLFVIRYWRRSLLDPSVRPGFVPFYLKREVKKRNSIIQEDKDILGIRTGLIKLEETVKDTELKIRQQHDYRFVLQYFSAARALHRTLVSNVTYLANEVEQLRANMDHSSESISIMEQQFVELETKYDRVVGGLVHREAFQLTVEDALYGMVNESHVDLKVGERLVKHILTDMDVGPKKHDVGSTFGENKDNFTPHMSKFERANESTQDVQANRLPGSDVDENTWAAPQSKALGHVSNIPKDPSGKTVAVEVAKRLNLENKYLFRGRDSRLGYDLKQVKETHRKACTRYENLVVELKDQASTLTVETAESSKLKDEALREAREWEARHGVLEQRLVDVENDLRTELAVSEEHANGERLLALGATSLLESALETVTPTLLDMVSTFAPRDTEGLGVALLRQLEIEPDLYIHLLATKQMFKADLESRAFEVLGSERKAIAEAELIEQEEVAARNKKKERGRPRTRGKGGGAASDKEKSGSKPNSKSGSKTSKSASGKGGKIGDKSDKAGGAGKGKATSKGKQKPTQKGSTSPKKDKKKSEKGLSDQQGEAKAKPSSSSAKKGNPKGSKKKK